MKIRRIAKILSISMLLAVFLYSTAIRELHYAFSVKYHTETHDHKCDHHIHSTEKEDDCLICKIDVNGIYHFEQSFYSFSAVFLPRPVEPAVSHVLFSTAYDTHYLRGPPAIA